MSDLSPDDGKVGKVPPAPVHPATFVCSKCGVEKPWGEKRRGAGRWCRLCAAAYQRERCARIKADPLATFSCSKCGRPQSFKEKPGGKGAVCRSCINEAQRIRRAKDPSPHRSAANRRRAARPDHYRMKARARYKANPRGKQNYVIRSLYGISIEQREAILRSQCGVCASCGDPVAFGSRASANTDHCHETGVVRAVLCARCNTALGLLDESPARIRALENYAEGCHHLKRTHQKPKEA